VVALQAQNWRSPQTNFETEFWGIIIVTFYRFVYCMLPR
jgi:hypothetical protein